MNIREISYWLNRHSREEGGNDRTLDCAIGKQVYYNTLKRKIFQNNAFVKKNIVNRR